MDGTVTLFSLSDGGSGRTLLTICGKLLRVKLLPIISFLPKGRIWLLRGRLPPTTGCYPATGCCPARGSLPISIPRVGS